jgi:hypothetical protein
MCSITVLVLPICVSSHKLSLTILSIGGIRRSELYKTAHIQSSPQAMLNLIAELKGISETRIPSNMNLNLIPDVLIVAI